MELATDPLSRLERLLAERVESAPDDANRGAAAQLRGHVADYLLPRARDLDAPLVVAVLGSTGSGKSSLFNALAGRRLSPSGVLRPTTREPVVVAHPLDAEVLRRGDLLPSLVQRGRLRVVEQPDARRGLLIVDAPDFDSVEQENRALAVELLEAADLIVFVTTAERYADQVPWEMLERAEQRGVPLLALLNRLPPDAVEAESVVRDYRRLLGDRRVADAGIGSGGEAAGLEIVPVTEGAIDPQTDALSADAIAPIASALDRLVADAESRRAVARRSLMAALSGLPEAVEAIARQVDHERAAIGALLEVARAAHGERRRALGDELGRGTFLRAEVLRQWQDFVGAGQIARFLTEGLGRIAATIRSMFEPGPQPPANEVREAAFADLVALTVAHSDAAARRTATAWSTDRFGSRALAAHPELWGSSTQLPDRLTRSLEQWATGIREEIGRHGAQRRGWALAATLGTNAMGTALVLAVFTHTGGLTGAEVGITAATAAVNHKLLEAIFGEASIQAFVAAARKGLGSLLDEAFTAEEVRFNAALGPAATAGDLADQLRAAAADAATAVDGPAPRS